MYKNLSMKKWLSIISGILYLIFTTVELPASDFTLNLNNVDIKTFIKLVGDFTKENYLIDPNVKGTITVYANKSVPSEQIDSIFKTILNLYGFSVIKKDSLSLIIPSTEARIRMREINVGEIPNDRMEDFFIQIIPLRYYPPDTLSQILTPYITKTGQITVDTRTNSLIISDTGSNIAKIQDIVSKIDVSAPPGKELLKIYRLENVDAEEVAKILMQLLSRPRQTARRGDIPPVQPSVVAAKATNSLIINADPDDFPNIEQIIKELDILTHQVLIEALIAEVSYDTTERIGIEWAATDTFDNERFTGGAGTNFGYIGSYAAGGAPPEGLSIGVYKGALTYPLDVGALVNLYSKEGEFNILSTPQIVTSDNQEAVINVSENIPYLKETRFIQASSSSSDTIKSYDYKDVGLTLKITPQISQDKYVRLKIAQEVTKVIEGGLTEAPTTAKRSVDTMLIVPNKKTVVLGGLVRDDTENTVKKVPFFGDIPLLGKLFRYNSKKVTKTNLLIFITPHIMTTFEEAEALRIEKEAAIMGDKLKK
ncbi:MAG: secretin N-terminal domain-containing protein [Candidatus Ratteibacteria bacterium]